jgi:hypothetical protein
VKKKGPQTPSTLLANVALDEGPAAVLRLVPGPTGAKRIFQTYNVKYKLYQKECGVKKMLSG